MPARYDLLVFDWDGTLMDSTATIVSALQLAFEEIGKPAPSAQQARHVIGLGLSEAMQYLDNSLTAEDLRGVVDAYRHHYLAQDGRITLFDGVAEALDRYRQAGFWLAVATGKSRRGLDRVLEVTGLGDVFDITRCADETFSKPHPEMLEQIMGYTGVAPERTLMVGDTTHDLQLARNARADGFAVSYGAHPLDELLACEPVGHAATFMELDVWLSLNA
ncbi:HAD-IA family hydrolase [Chitinivorax sp. PXF-14]|uniref:HAD-IA family hydrolase n=1 Tax=Chitinivorax sp. PXF-14 TaxID=3230488 RepID=UPI0034678495